ncbi:MAG: D-alanine--D-alanine ligase [Bacteroidetes bacterium]|nr:D-alanine--D-alanine ligase [Bacteroidota bacterium]
MMRNIAIVTGGDSSEYVVSIKSGANVLQAIDRKLFTPWMVFIRNGEWNVLDGERLLTTVDRSDFSFNLNGERIRFEYAYIMIHGTPGEDGNLQGYFEMLGIPYSSCGVQSSALTFNKNFTNKYLQSYGIQMAKSIRLVLGEKLEPVEVVKELGLPLFVKPSAGGSSFGVTKVKKANELGEAVDKAMKESPEVLIEQFIDGKEFTCGVVKIGEKKLVLPVTEVISKNEFFDYEAKYIPGMADEITPARINEVLTLKIQDLSSRIYDLCNCKGIVRVDYILKDQTFYFLEINTVPGMTATSFIPQQIKAAGLDLTELLTEIIQDSIK